MEALLSEATQIGLPTSTHVLREALRGNPIVLNERIAYLIAHFEMFLRYCRTKPYQ
jgi:hypothetical protein